MTFIPEAIFIYHVLEFIVDDYLVPESDAGALSWSEYIAVPEFLFSIFSSDDISFFYPARRELHFFRGVSHFVRGGIPDSEVFSFGAEHVEFIEIYGTIYG